MSKKHPGTGPRDAAVALIKQIADRAVDVYAKCDIRADRITIVMDFMLIRLTHTISETH